MIGFLIKGQFEPTAICAFTWAGTASNPAGVRLFLKIDWQQPLPADLASYFEDLQEDWKMTMQTQPDVVPAMTRELSVGPIRLMEQVSMLRDLVGLFLEERLGKCLHIPGMLLVK